MIFEKNSLYCFCMNLSLENHLVACFFIKSRHPSAQSHACVTIYCREKVLKKEFSHERDSLQKSLDIATSLVETKNVELQGCRDEVGG